MKIPIIRQEITKDMRTRIVANSMVVIIGICVYFLFLNWASVKGSIGHFFSIIEPFIYGFAIAYLLSIPLNFVERKFLHKLKLKGKVKLERVLAIVIVLLVTFTIIILLFSVLIPQLGKNFTIFVANISNYVNNAEKFVQDLIAQLPISNTVLNSYVGKLNDLMNNTANKMTDYIPVLVEYSKNITTSLYSLIIGIILSIYMLYSKERFCAQFKKVIYALFKKDTVEHILELSSQSNRTFIGFLSGKIIDSFIIGCICFIFMYIVHMPYALFVSVIVGVTDIVPFFGPIVGAILGMFIIFVVDPIAAFWFGIFILILQIFNGNVLGPKILGSSTGLSAFGVIFAILVGGGFFGIIGMILGVPTVAVIYSLFRAFVDSKLRKKDLPTAVQDYVNNDQQLQIQDDDTEEKV